jgi:hypothetical protein
VLWRSIKALEEGEEPGLDGYDSPRRASGGAESGCGKRMKAMVALLMPLSQLSRESDETGLKRRDDAMRRTGVTLRCLRDWLRRAEVLAVSRISGRGVRMCS